MDGYEKDQLFSSLYEILNLYYRTNDLKQTLEFSLEKILKFSWLEVESKAGILSFWVCQSNEKKSLYGGHSSVWLEHLVVAQKVMGSSPIAHPPSFWPHRLTIRTSLFQGENTGSSKGIPSGDSRWGHKKFFNYEIKKIHLIILHIFMLLKLTDNI
jgi:hypothetical protein